jgi:hypothetical protein
MLPGIAISPFYGVGVVPGADGCATRPGEAGGKGKAAKGQKRVERLQYARQFLNGAVPMLLSAPDAAVPAFSPADGSAALPVSAGALPLFPLLGAPPLASGSAASREEAAAVSTSGAAAALHGLRGGGCFAGGGCASGGCAGGCAAAVGGGGGFMMEEMPIATGMHPGLPGAQPAPSVLPNAGCSAALLLPAAAASCPPLASSASGLLPTPAAASSSLAGGSAAIPFGAWPGPSGPAGAQSAPSFLPPAGGSAALLSPAAAAASCSASFSAAFPAFCGILPSPAYVGMLSAASSSLAGYRDASGSPSGALPDPSDEDAIHASRFSPRGYLLDSLGYSSSSGSSSYSSGEANAAARALRFHNLRSLGGNLGYCASLLAETQRALALAKSDDATCSNPATLGALAAALSSHADAQQFSQKVQLALRDAPALTHQWAAPPPAPLPAEQPGDARARGGCT